MYWSEDILPSMLLPPGRETPDSSPLEGEGTVGGPNPTQATGMGRPQAAKKPGPATPLKAQTIKEDERNK